MAASSSSSARPSPYILLKEDDMNHFNGLEAGVKAAAADNFQVFWSLTTEKGSMFVLPGRKQLSDAYTKLPMSAPLATAASQVHFPAYYDWVASFAVHCLLDSSGE